MLTATMATPTGATGGDPVRSTFLPKEHGSWSLALEPLALGLLIAPSWAGGALAGAVLAGFFARRPLKAALAPLHSARRVVARETVVMFSALAVAGLFEAVVLGGWSALGPLLPAAGFGALFLLFEAQGESRSALAEVAGGAAFAFVPAALALLAGAPLATALALAVLAAARSLPAIFAVRAYLRAARHDSAGPLAPLVVALLALVAVVALVAQSLAPEMAGWLGALLFFRTVWLVAPWGPAWPARRIGQMEAVLGFLYVVFLAGSWPSP